MYWNLSAANLGIATDLAGAITLAKRHGFDGVDLPMQEVATLGPARVKDMLAEAGLRPGSWGPPVDWRGAQDVYNAHLDALPALASIAQELGATRAATWVPPASRERPFEENVAFHVRRFRPIAEILRDHGCRLGLEFIGPKTSRPAGVYEFVYTAAGMLDLCAAIGTGNLGLLLDCWHWYTSGGTREDLARLNDADVVVAHVNDAPAGIAIEAQIDNQRTLPGETGVIDIADFLQELERMGYGGPVTVEPFSDRVRAMPPDEAAAATAESLRKVWAQAGIAR